MSARRIVFNAMLIALFFALSMIAIDLGNVKLTFSGLPVIIAGALFGPVDGLIVGALGSFSEQMLKYGFGPTTLLWILPQAIRGLLVGLYARQTKFNMTNAQLIVALIITAVIQTALNTYIWYIDSLLYNYYDYTTIFGYALLRIVVGAVTAVAYAAILPPIIDALRKVSKVNSIGG